MSQNNDIIRVLKSGIHLTPLSALRMCKTMKLASRLTEIRRSHPELIIRDKWVKIGDKMVKEYWLERIKK